MSKPYSKLRTLADVRAAVLAVNDRFRDGHAPIEHRIVAVIVAWLGCFQAGIIRPEHIHEVWEDFSEIGRTFREDFVLEPDFDGDRITFTVMAVNGIESAAWGDADEEDETEQRED